MKLQFTADGLRRKIETDPDDDEPMAGGPTMSWSASTKGRVMKQDAEAAIDEISYEHGEIDGPMMDQIQAARRAAKELVKTIPGEYVTVSMSGHANGVGWHPKAGWANDTITVSVTQHHE